MSRKIPGLVVLLAIGFAVAITSCGGSASTAQPVSPPTLSYSGRPIAASLSSPTPSPAAVPSGYRRIGGATQGISLAVPASWVVIDLTNETIDRAVYKAGFTGASAAMLIQDAQALQKLHGLFVVEVKSARHFPANLTAFCFSSGVTETGSAGLSFLRQASMAQFQQLHAGHISQRDIRVGGVPGVETSYTLVSPTAGTVYAAQIAVLPHPERACAITLGAARGQFPDDALAVAASTAEFPA